MDELVPIYKAYAFPSDRAPKTPGTYPTSVSIIDNTYKPSDEEISRTLKVAKAKVLQMLGSSVTELNLPRDGEEGGSYPVQEAVLFLTRFFFQNRNFYQRIFEMELSNLITDREVRGFDPELPKAVYLHIAGLISSERKATDFMP